HRCRTAEKDDEMPPSHLAPRFRVTLATDYSTPRLDRNPIPFRKALIAWLLPFVLELNDDSEALALHQVACPAAPAANDQIIAISITANVLLERCRSALQRR